MSQMKNKPTFSAGFGGRAGDSKSMYAFCANKFSIFDSFGDNIYMMDGDGLVVYDKNAKETNISFEINTNVCIDEDGSVFGPTAKGFKIWRQNEISSSEN